MSTMFIPSAGSSVLGPWSLRFWPCRGLRRVTVVVVLLTFRYVAPPSRFFFPPLHPWKNSFGSQFDLQFFTQYPHLSTDHRHQNAHRYAALSFGEFQGVSALNYAIFLLSVNWIYAFTLSILRVWVRWRGNKSISSINLMCGLNWYFFWAIVIAIVFFSWWI